MKEILYESGKRIKDEWIIISILEVRKQNKKIIFVDMFTIFLFLLYNIIVKLTFLFV